MDDRHRNPDHDDAADDAADAGAAGVSGGAPHDERRAPIVVRIGHETADCRSYRPGHTVHFIQARHASNTPSRYRCWPRWTPRARSW